MERPSVDVWRGVLFRVCRERHRRHVRIVSPVVYAETMADLHRLRGRHLARLLHRAVWSESATEICNCGRMFLHCGGVRHYYGLCNHAFEDGLWVRDECLRMD